MFVTSLVLGLVGVFCILDSRLLGRLNFERSSPAPSSACCWATCRWV